MRETASIGEALEMARGMKACLFDMDGLIFDTERCFMEQLSVVMSEYGYRLTKEIYCETLGLSGDVLRETMTGHYGDYPFHEVGRKARDRVGVIAETVGLSVKPEIRKILARLAGEGVPCAVASGSRSDVVERYLETAGLRQYFGAVAGAEKVSRSKPAPDIFELAAELLQVNCADCVVLEDSENGVLAGREAGCTTVCVPDLKMPRREYFDDIDYLVQRTENY